MVFPQVMLHCSGRMIPQVIACLSPKLDENLRNLIASFHEKVVVTLGKKKDEEEAKEVADALNQLAVQLKEAVITMRKGSVSE